MQTVKEEAIKDIRDTLKKESKSFIAFHRELNPIMDKIVAKYIKRQEGKK